LQKDQNRKETARTHFAIIAQNPDIGWQD